MPVVTVSCLPGDLTEEQLVILQEALVAEAVAMPGVSARRETRAGADIARGPGAGEGTPDGGRAQGSGREGGAR